MIIIPLLPIKKYKIIILIINKNILFYIVLAENYLITY